MPIRLTSTLCYNTDMRIAVISDLHDNITAWQSILRVLEQEQIATLLNCGDTCAPATLRHLAETFTGEIHTVFGNVADKPLETERAKTLSNVHHYGEQADVTIEQRRICLTHYPEIARREAQSGAYDLVCYGHDHTKHAERIGATLLLNPGTAGGLFQYPSFATIDLDTMTHQFHEVTL